MRTGAAALHAAIGRADAVEGRPFGARVGRRHVHERQPGCRPTRAWRCRSPSRRRSRGSRRPTAAPRRSPTEPRSRAPTCGGRRAPSQRSLAITKGRWMPASASASGSSASDHRTITRQPVLRELDERPRSTRLGPSGRADEVDLALELELADPRLDERACGQVVLDGRARDERDAVARRVPRSSPIPAGRARVGRRDHEGAGRRDAVRRRSSAGRRRLPASRSASRACSSSSVIVRPANGCPGGQARMTVSLRNGSYSTPRWRGAAPTTPSCRLRSATRSTTVCVSNTLSATCSSGAPRRTGRAAAASTTPPGPVEAPISNCPASSPARLVRELADDLLLELQAAAARRGRAGAPPRSARRAAPSDRGAASRAASRARVPGG